MRIMIRDQTICLSHGDQLEFMGDFILLHTPRGTSLIRFNLAGDAISIRYSLTAPSPADTKDAPAG